MGTATISFTLDMVMHMLCVNNDVHCLNCIYKGLSASNKKLTKILFLSDIVTFSDLWFKRAILTQSYTWIWATTGLKRLGYNLTPNALHLMFTLLVCFHGFLVILHQKRILCTFSFNKLTFIRVSFRLIVLVVGNPFIFALWTVAFVLNSHDPPWQCRRDV